MIVLFLNHKAEKCGVYQYGRRVYDILKKTEDIEYIYKEIDCLQEYNECLNLYSHANCIIYNYHGSTMPWLNIHNIQRRVKNIGIPHESPEYLFDIVCNIDPNAAENENHFSLPRPIYENVDEIIQKTEYKNPEIIDFITKYTDTDIPIFGSFGFGFSFKGFDKIVKMVNEQYDKAIIKFVIPISHFDSNPNTIQIMKDLCISQNVKSGIELIFIHKFFTNEILIQ